MSARESDWAELRLLVGDECGYRVTRCRNHAHWKFFLRHEVQFEVGRWDGSRLNVLGCGPSLRAALDDARSRLADRTEGAAP